MKTIRKISWHFFILLALLFMTSGCMSTAKIATYESSIKEYDMRYMLTKSELEIMSSTLPFLRWFGFKPPYTVRNSLFGGSYYKPMGFSPILTALCLVDLPFSFITDTFMYYIDNKNYEIHILPRELKKKEQLSVICQ